MNPPVRTDNLRNISRRRCTHTPFSAPLAPRIVMLLSLGLEFEVVVHSLKPAAPIPSSTLAQLTIVSKALTSAGLQALPFIPTSTRASPNYTIWNVVTDATIQEVTSNSDASDSAFQSRFGVELVSPVFEERSGEAWKEEVRRALAAIAQRVEWKANRSTGLHVHIGLKVRISVLNCHWDLSQPPPQLHLIRCVLFIGLPEMTTSCLTATTRSSRIWHFRKYMSSFKAPLTFKRVAELCSPRRCQQQWLWRVSKFEVLQGQSFCFVLFPSLLTLIYFQVNFTSLARHRTVEFRQHEGTVSADSAIAWAEFIRRFVNFALSTTDVIVVAEGETLDHLRALVTLPWPVTSTGMM